MNYDTSIPYDQHNDHHLSEISVCELVKNHHSDAYLYPEVGVLVGDGER